MNILLLISGIVVVSWSLMESFWTILWIAGDSAPLTSRLTSLCWRLFRFLLPDDNHKALSLAGPFILGFSILGWILFLWLGWTLIFYSDPSSIASTRSNQTPDFTDVLWYIGYCLFTIGNGDFTPKGDGWQIVSSFVGLSGMLLITLSVTYFLQVVSAVVNKRSFASQVCTVGSSPEEFILKFWNGRDLKAMEIILNSFSQQLSTITEQHLAFPILHYYHTKSDQKSLGRALAILYDALLLLEHGVEEDKRPIQAYLQSTQESAKSFLTTLKSAFIDKAERVPPLPFLSKLHNKGVPTLSEQQCYQNLKKEEEIRKLILGLVENNKWQWPN